MIPAADNPRIHEFVEGASRLPVLPQVTVRLLKALDSNDSSSRGIARIVEAEPALAARLLKLANSSFYGHRGTIAKVENAITILGSKTIRSMALTLWTHTLRSQGRTPEEMALLAPLLAHGLAVGVVARLLAARISAMYAEDAFMAGLLHDIGRVALVAHMGVDYRRQVIDEALLANTGFRDKEIELLGFDHGGLGAVLMMNWTLPGFLAKVAEVHHSEVTDPRANVVIAAVTLADGIATRMGFNLMPTVVRPEPPELVTFFGLDDEAEMTGFLEGCMAAFNTMTEVLNRR